MMKRILQRWPCGAVAVGSVGNAAWAEEKAGGACRPAPAALHPQRSTGGGRCRSTGGCARAGRQQG